jgi:hypothetical protein
VFARKGGLPTEYALMVRVSSRPFRDYITGVFNLKQSRSFSGVCFTRVVSGAGFLLLSTSSSFVFIQFYA